MARKKSTPTIVEVVDNVDLEKNLDTGTVTLRNPSLVDGRRQLKERLKQEKEYIVSLEDRIAQLEKLVMNLTQS